jgi:peptide-methionine (R)-S-oxide reductase
MVSDSEWKKKLTKEQYAVLREKNTERPFSGKYVKFDKSGDFVCVACGNVLFDSSTKFDAHCGWPSFSEARKDSVEFHNDSSYGMQRTEVLCKKCGGHLGHVFDDGPKEMGGKRYCINSVSLDFKEKKVVKK